MRKYLELPIRGGQENSLPPSAPPKKQLSIAKGQEAQAGNRPRDKARYRDMYIHNVILW